MFFFVLIIFVNLHKYLKDEELIELYKYSRYNEINILIIEQDNNEIIEKLEDEIIYYIDKDFNEEII